DGRRTCNGRGAGRRPGGPDRGAEQGFDVRRPDRERRAGARVRSPVRPHHRRLRRGDSAARSAPGAGNRRHERPDRLGHDCEADERTGRSPTGRVRPARRRGGTASRKGGGDDQDRLERRVPPGDGGVDRPVRPVGGWWRTRPPARAGPV
ncbi:MAG: hypothetical protein AVDCRST_MAG59-5213, partial [uncultured Thermomicrobiales bacterium]